MLFLACVKHKINFKLKDIDMPSHEIKSTTGEEAQARYHKLNAGTARHIPPLK